MRWTHFDKMINKEKEEKKVLSTEDQEGLIQWHILKHFDVEASIGNGLFRSSSFDVV